MFPRPVIPENRSHLSRTETLLRTETVANALPSKSHVRPRGLREKRERGKKKKKKNTSDTRRSNWRITILGVLFDQSIDIENSFYYEVSRAKEIFSPYLMIYLFSSHFTNDKRLWKGKSDVNQRYDFRWVTVEELVTVERATCIHSRAIFIQRHI